MHEKRFAQEIERLRDPERIARLEVERVANLALGNLADPETVLDIGTGSGLFAGEFSARGLQVTGLDANPAMLLAARHYVPEGVFHEGVAEELPFPDGSFDLVFMGLVLHETDDTLEALHEAHRVTRQRLAILEWPDEEQLFGPPREDRLNREKLNGLISMVGFKQVTSSRLQNLVLYLLDR